MPLSEILGKHGDAVRSVTGLNGKLSISDMTKYVSELVRVNLLSNTTSTDKVLQVKSGDWSTKIETVHLNKGIYSYSVEFDNNTSRLVSLRFEHSSGKIRSVLNPEDNMPWGIVPNCWKDTSKNNFVSYLFEVCEPGNIYVGFSGNPFADGNITYRKPMLNTGTLPLPYTSNTLEGS